jgi:hypothetical protein
MKEATQLCVQHIPFRTNVQRKCRVFWKFVVGYFVVVGVVDEWYLKGAETI